jgi:hypothetical protein
MRKLKNQIKKLKSFFAINSSKEKNIVGYRNAPEDDSANEITYGSESYYNDEKLKYCVSIKELHEIIQNNLIPILNISIDLQERLKENEKFQNCKFISIFCKNLSYNKNSLDDTTSSSNNVKRSEIQNQNAQNNMYDVVIDCENLRKDAMNQFILGIIESIKKSSRSQSS